MRAREAVEAPAGSVPYKGYMRQHRRTERMIRAQGGGVHKHPIHRLTWNGAQGSTGEGTLYVRLQSGAVKIRLVSDLV